MAHSIRPSTTAHTASTQPSRHATEYNNHDACGTGNANAAGAVARWV